MEFKQIDFAAKEHKSAAYMEARLLVLAASEAVRRIGAPALLVIRPVQHHSEPKTFCL